MRSYKSILMAGALAAVMVGGGVAIAQRGMDLKAAVADPSRPKADTDRDADRKPAELIALSGLKAGDSVAELAAGGGYFTRILTDAVGPKGHVYAFGVRKPNPQSPPSPGPTLDDFAAAHPGLMIMPAAPAGTIPVPASVDLVWTTQNYHDFENGKTADGTVAALAYNVAAFKALKPGGIYFISDHEAGPNAPDDVTSKLHRIGSDRVKKEVEAAGFKLEKTSNLLAHAPDDHTQRVFETGVRGKTDQFIMVFRKPK